MIEYDKFIKYLYSFQDIKYKNFHKKLILDDNLIGIRSNNLKIIAKKIAKNDYKKFILYNKHELYEEKILHGLVLGYLKLDFSELIPMIDEFIPYIDNWAICDCTVANLKIFSKNKEAGLKEIKKYLKNKNTWINRFGYVLLLNYYIEDKYIDTIFKLCNKYKDEYYVKMSIAWLISTCYVKSKEKTLEYLKYNKLDDWTYNKSIQKIIESNRVNKTEKDILKRMKRK